MEQTKLTEKIESKIGFKISNSILIILSSVVIGLLLTFFGDLLYHMNLNICGIIFIITGSIFICGSLLFAFICFIIKLKI